MTLVAETVAVALDCYAAAERCYNAICRLHEVTDTDDSEDVEDEDEPDECDEPGE